MEVDGCDVQNKKGWFFTAAKQIYQWWRLMVNPPGAMNLLSWNCWGLGNLLTKQELRDLIQAQDPSVVFLAETWLDKVRLEEIRSKIKFGGMIEVCRDMRRGGGEL